MLHPKEKLVTPNPPFKKSIKMPTTHIFRSVRENAYGLTANIFPVSSRVNRTCSSSDEKFCA